MKKMWIFLLVLLMAATAAPAQDDAADLDAIIGDLGEEFAEEPVADFWESLPEIEVAVEEPVAETVDAVDVFVPVETVEEPPAPDWIEDVVPEEPAAAWFAGEEPVQVEEFWPVDFDEETPVQVEEPIAAAEPEAPVFEEPVAVDVWGDPIAVDTAMPWEAPFEEPAAPEWEEPAVEFIEEEEWGLPQSASMEETPAMEVVEEPPPAEAPKSIPTPRIPAELDLAIPVPEVSAEPQPEPEVPESMPEPQIPPPAIRAKPAAADDLIAW